MTSAAVRALWLSLYVRRFREELKGSPYLSGQVTVGEGYRSFDLPAAAADLDTFKVAQLRREFTLTPEMAAEAYKEALASRDPDKNQRRASPPPRRRSWARRGDMSRG
jgi:hypothetical protein